MPKTFYVLPEKLEIEGQLDPEIRYRGTYKVIVYESVVHFNGTFNFPDLNNYGICSLLFSLLGLAP
ncbi:MAG: cell envelope integrity protein CreD [Bacteroidales bacterium]|nr:cell envelope integrity protein CreD [Bacteroidales bacterium]